MGYNMAKKDKKEIWVFPDSKDVQLPLYGVYLGCKDEISAGAVQYPVITIDCAGQLYKISHWKVKSLACERLWGSDDDHWKGKQIQLFLDDKKKLVLAPMIEDVLEH